MDKLNKLKWRKTVRARVELTRKKFDDFIASGTFAPSLNNMHKRKPVTVHLRRILFLSLGLVGAVYGGHIAASNDPLVAYNVKMRQREIERINSREYPTAISLDLP